MKATSHSTVKRLRAPILRSVSRSFYLSIRLLPVKLRDPIALAYLLARATDTIADTVDIPSATRLTELERLAALIQGQTAGRTNSFVAFAELQKEPAERALMHAIPDCLTWLESTPESDRDDIRRVLALINEGQKLDVRRFSNPAQISALQTASDLDRYTYLVAGCVGEFWTNVCFRHLAKFSDRPREEMLSLGKDYGQGLQLVNILRDAGADLRAGRCYLPADELRSLGIAPEELLAAPLRAEPLLRVWHDRAEQGMAAGLEYACAIRPRRVRLATALPTLIGARTLSLLRTAGARAFEEKIKIGRAEVRQIIFHTVRTLAAPRALRAAFVRRM
ncbi:MAG: squalene/phytoene synthase family protein [Verrucomicrobiota bacterium]|nr:squalene/phytoene synthase family protein [Verrucomicrobiota bacterium]